MPFIPNTSADRKKMLQTIGVKSFEQLIEAIPTDVRLEDDLNLPPALSEYEVTKLMKSYANKNISADTHAIFAGAGAYDHYTPAVVNSIIERPEFKTAYTPYQAEVSQGTLQAIYEFQSMICELTQMDIANASLYDGGQALAEAIVLAHRKTKRKKIILAGPVNEHYTQTAKTINAGFGLQYIYANGKDTNGKPTTTADYDMLAAAALAVTAGNTTDAPAAVVVQVPNFYGQIDNLRRIEQLAHSAGALLIIVANPLALGILEAPGRLGADIVCGDAQPLGLPLNYGGPYLGYFAIKSELQRMMPGRIVGRTKDTEGNDGFVLTLQTREQHIRRDKATSNICSNQGLYMLAATVYMATMGKAGLQEVASQCVWKAHYLAKQISLLDSYVVDLSTPFFNEFLVQTERDIPVLIKRGIDNGLLAGVHIKGQAGSATPRSGLLIAVTEKRTKAELDALVALLK